MANKKQLVADTIDFKRMIQGFLSASNSTYALKEKSNNFLDKMIDYVDDGDGDSTDPNEETDGLHNTIPVTNKNLKYLLSLFTKDEEQKKTDPTMTNPLTGEIIEEMSKLMYKELKKIIL